MNESYCMDIRAIHMTKSSSQYPIQRFAEENVSKKNTFICLGHFDVLRIEGIQNCSPCTDSDVSQFHPLEAIRDYADNQTIQQNLTANTTHILYIIKQIETTEPSQQKKSFNDFWDRENNYTVISRFHCDKVPDEEEFTEEQGSSDQNFINILEERCKLNKENENVSLYGIINDGFIAENVVLHNGAEVKTSVFATFYDSLDLGDIIGVFKGNSLEAILELQRHISEAPIVSDDYTYCGIATSLIGSEYSVLEDNIKKQIELQNAILPYVVTRFSIKLAKAADSYLKFFNDHNRSYVLGNEDIVLTFGPCKEETFLILIKKFLDDGKDHGIIYDAFYDIITRVGLAYIEPYSSRTRNLQPLEVITEEEIKPIKSWNAPPDWLPSFFKLLSAYKAMGENCVTDDLALLLSPSVKALICRIKSLKRVWEREYDNKICMFLSAWSSLAEEIYRVENQLAQHPELSPPQSYIPATLLLFDLTMIINYEDLLWNIDEICSEESCRPHRNYAPILVPEFSSETSTLCILDPKQDTEYTNSTPLIIRLPIHDLYQPWKMMHVLVHELSHYCGESIRDRPKRWECLCRCMAEYILIIWEHYLDYRLLSDEAALKDAHAEFKKTITSLIKNSYKYCSAQTYLDDITDHLSDITVSIAQNYKLQLEYRRMILDSADLSTQLRNIHEKGRTTAMELGAAFQTRIPEHISKCLVALFKECFADMVMILLLDCSLEDYYRCVYKDEYELLFRNKSEDKGTMDLPLKRICEKHTDRLSIVTIVMQQIDANWASKQCNDSWVVAAKKKKEYWESKTSKPISEHTQQQNQQNLERQDCYYIDFVDPYVLSVGEIDEIYDYLYSCALTIKKALYEDTEDSVKIKQMKEKLIAELTNSKGGCFNWNRMRKYTNASKKYIHEWCKDFSIHSMK